MKVLVVDDSNSMLEYIRIIFKELGITDLLFARDGTEALKVFGEHKDKLDMIFTDWNMPMLDGVSLVKRIREIDTTNEIYITMVTTECDRLKVIEALEAGADNYVVKPFSNKRVVSIIEDYKKSKLEQKVY